MRNALASAAEGDFAEQATKLLDVLGYRSERTLPGQSGAVDDFLEQFPAKNPGTKSEARFREAAASIHVLFQVTDEEISAADGNPTLFSDDEFQSGNARSFLFTAVELRGREYPRGRYAAFTREINKRFPAIPAVVLFRTASGAVTLAFVRVRPNKRNPERNVIGSVSLIREIALADPHRAHLNILAELSLADRLSWMEQHGQPRNFDGLLAAWLDALDTEELNRRFYKDLFAWFQRAVDTASFPTDQPRILSPEEHVIRLITRLLFVWFIKEKRLIAEALFVENQVARLLRDYDRAGDSYYRGVLQNLFFATLNTEIERRSFSRQTNATHREFSRYRYKNEIADSDALVLLFAQTPFINGGLFDCLDSEEAGRDGGYRIDCFTDNPAQRRGYSMPNALFFDEDDRRPGLITLFNRYKFTVEENTPAEQEVALDPELLGKVFENLLAAYNPETRETARRQTGSYYTPRPVVDYMVEEALVASLVGKMETASAEYAWWEDRLRYLLDYNDAFEDAAELFTEGESDEVVRAIAGLKVLDPAVGSGAFPMGVLNKLTLALRRLDPDNARWETLQKDLAGKRAKAAFDTRDQQERDAELAEISATFERYRGSDFGRKLYLIQNSIYGVDIQAVATQIAKLRFFISLAIEQQPTGDRHDNYGIKPLPNLETRFVAADTLLGLERPPQMSFAQTGAVAACQQRLNDNRERHFHATTRREKLKCRREDAVLRTQLAVALRESDFPAADAAKISGWDPYDLNASADWFDPDYMFGIAGGFDVVIGNPPYVKVEHLDDIDRRTIKDSFGWLGDLYEHFIFRGNDLVSNGGALSYIANDSFVTFSSKKRVRKLMLSNTLLLLVRTPAQTFAASIYAAIFLMLKQQPYPGHSYEAGRMVANEGFEYQSLGKIRYGTVDVMPDQRFLLAGDASLLERLLAMGRSADYCRVLDTGIHSGNVRSKIFFAKDNGKRHRLLQGRQIQKYSLEWDRPKAKYKYCDINYVPLSVPGVGRGGRPSSRNEYWHFCGPVENHHQPERLLMRQTDDDLVATYHNELQHGSFYTDNTLFTILSSTEAVNLKYLLALYNSKLLNFVYHAISQEQGKSQAQVKVKNVSALPIVLPDDDQERAVVALVERILRAKNEDPGSDTSALEREIDQLVYEVYGLTASDIATIDDGWPP